jgi:hypothetical protein
MSSVAGGELRVRIFRWKSPSMGGDGRRPSACERWTGRLRQASWNQEVGHVCR